MKYLDHFAPGWSYHVKSIQLVGSLVAVIAQAVRDQSMERAPLVIFALAALVLVLFMLRT